MLVCLVVLRSQNNPAEGRQIGVPSVSLPGHESNDGAGSDHNGQEEDHGTEQKVHS